MARQVWRNYNANTYIDKFSYGYDYSSNRLYRKNELSAALGELYHENDATAQQEYDGLNRLKTFRRGTLATGNGSITDANAARAEVFTLDSVGNWKTYLAANGSGGTLVTQWDQDRAINKANEITGLTQRTGTWVAPAYDARGNAVTMPRPGDPTAPFTCRFRCVEPADESE